MTEVARHELPDLPDRIIGATALFYNVPVLSRDGRIRASSIQTIW
jgi:predicted nucleic acid-binding protein